MNIRWSAAIWFMVVVVIVLVIGGFLSFVFWDWLRSGTGTPESNSATIRNVGLLVGAAIALIFAIWRSWVAERQANAAQRQAETADLGLLNDRYQKAADMLGSSVIAVRLGGIDALRGLAEQYPERFHVQTMRLLCAFVRNSPVARESCAGYTVSEEGEPPDDVRVAIWAISKCHAENLGLEEAGQSTLDLGSANLRRSYLPGVNLSNASLRHTDLSSSYLIHANLTSAHLDYADLSKSHLEDAVLFRATLSNTRVARADFGGTNLSQANLIGLDLSNGNLTRAVLINAILNEVDLTGSQLQRANLARVVFNPALLADVKANDADLSGAKIQGGNLRRAVLDRANLSSADLINANLTEASLRRANLSGTYLRGANLSRTDLTDADMSGAGLSFEGQFPATGLRQSQIDEARADRANPPELDGVFDAVTGEQLMWNGKPLER